MIACHNNNKELALALVKLGADIDATNNVSKVWPGHCMAPGVSREECLEAVSESICGLALLSRCFDSADVQTAVHTTHTCTKHNYWFNNAIRLLCTTAVVA